MTTTWRHEEGGGRRSSGLVRPAIRSARIRHSSMAVSTHVAAVMVILHSSIAPLVDDDAMADGAGQLLRKVRVKLLRGSWDRLKKCKGDSHASRCLRSVSE
jgi:hypothetical protein